MKGYLAGFAFAFMAVTGISHGLLAQTGSASEIFLLRGECAKIGREFKEGGGGPQPFVSTHYSPTLNRCFLLLTHGSTSSLPFSLLLIDGQTNEVWGYATIDRNGRKGGVNDGTMVFTDDAYRTNADNIRKVMNYE